MTESRDQALDRLAEEYVELARRGEAPDIDAFAAAHPELQDELREILPVLSVVEGLKGRGPRRSGAGAEAPTQTPDDLLGSRIAGYRLVRELGRGGMGRVYEGQGQDLDPPRVAIKVIHPHLGRRMEYLARFLREAEVGRRIRHPGVVRTLDVGLFEHGGEELPHLVLEYVEGQSLRSLLVEVGTVPERLCRHIGVRLALALAAIHAEGLVHRDVKPENVVITADETVKLMDMGVAVLRDGTGLLTSSGDFVGSLLYASPAQMLGMKPSPMWDLHALGVMLYELASGQHPAVTRTTGVAPGAPPVPLRRVNPRVSPFLEAVVDALMQPHAEDPALETAARIAEVLEEGETSSWWRARPHRTAAPTSSRATFHGRRSEWALLDRLLGDVEAGEGRALLVIGDAGMGKTALLEAWLAAHREAPGPRAALVRYAPGAGGGLEDDLGAALLSLIDGPDLASRLRTWLGTRGRLATLLTRFLRGARQDPDGPRGLEAALVRLLAGLSRERPVVVVFEDLHFAPPSERRRFLLLARALGTSRVLLVGTARPLPDLGWAAELETLGHAGRLILKGLDGPACRALIQEATRDLPHLTKSAVRLTDRADRNPFFLLELVQDLAHRHVADIGAESSTIPGSIHSVVAARLATLDAEARELLDVAACCGHGFDPLLVADAAQRGRIDALKRFGRLEREHHLLRSAGRDYRFHHHLVQEVLLEDLHPSLKEAYHLALGDTLERLATEPVDGATAVRLCTHYFEGGAPERAREHVRSAIEHLGWSLYDSEGASALAERALAIEGLLEDESRAFALLDRGSRLQSEARSDEARPALDEALALAHRTGQGAVEEDALRVLARIARVEGDIEGMEAAYQRSAALAEARGDRPRVAMALGGLGNALTRMGRLDDGAQALTEGLAALGDDPDPCQRGRLLSYLAEIEIGRGRREEAKPVLEEAQTLAHAFGDLPTEALILSSLGNIAHGEGRYGETREWIRRGLEVERQLGYPHLLVHALGNLAQTEMNLGAFDAGLTALEEATRLAEQRADREQLATVRMRRGWIRAWSGDLVGALQDLEEARSAAREVRKPGPLAASTVGLVELHAVLGASDEASALGGELEKAMEKAPAPVRARVGHARGRAWEAAGRYEEARTAHTDARSLTRETDALHFEIALALGRVARRLGDEREAASHFQQALGWAREVELPRVAVPASAHLAALGHGDLLTVRVAVEEGAPSLPVEDRIDAHFALWEAEHDPVHLDRARAVLAGLRVPEAHRESIREAVDLHRRVLQA